MPKHQKRLQWERKLSCLVKGFRNPHTMYVTCAFTIPYVNTSKSLDLNDQFLMAAAPFGLPESLYCVSCMKFGRLLPSLPHEKLFFKLLFTVDRANKAKSKVCKVCSSSCFVECGKGLQEWEFTCQEFFTLQLKIDLVLKIFISYCILVVNGQVPVRDDQKECRGLHVLNP